MSNERMRGTEEEFAYNYAWSILEGMGNLERFKIASPAFAALIADAIEVIRSNRPEYREVYIEGLDDASVDSPQ